MLYLFIRMGNRANQCSESWCRMFQAWTLRKLTWLTHIAAYFCVLYVHCYIRQFFSLFFFALTCIIFLLSESFFALIWGSVTLLPAFSVRGFISLFKVLFYLFIFFIIIIYHFGRFWFVFRVARKFSKNLFSLLNSSCVQCDSCKYKLYVL